MIFLKMNRSKDWWCITQSQYIIIIIPFIAVIAVINSVCCSTSPHHTPKRPGVPPNGPSGLDLSGINPCPSNSHSHSYVILYHPTSSYILYHPMSSFIILQYINMFFEFNQSWEYLRPQKPVDLGNLGRWGRNATWTPSWPSWQGSSWRRLGDVYRKVVGWLGLGDPKVHDENGNSQDFSWEYNWISWEYDKIYLVLLGFNGNGTTWRFLGEKIIYRWDIFHGNAWLSEGRCLDPCLRKCSFFGKYLDLNSIGMKDWNPCVGLEHEPSCFGVFGRRHQSPLRFSRLKSRRRWVIFSSWIS